MPADKPLAFVLGGGGSRGALEIGALQALHEAGLTPDILVGTSIGAINAVGVALLGYSNRGLEQMTEHWKEIEDAQILDPRVLQLVVRSLIGRPSHRARERVRSYLIDLGITPDLQFKSFHPFKVGLVSADIETGQPIIYGQDPNERVLDGVMASITLPPWFTPEKKDGQLIVDGGALSNLPIEPALRLGAGRIIALDLDFEQPAESQGGVQIPLQKYLEKLTFAVSKRYIQLETALAEQQGVPVLRIDFREIESPQTWDFRNTSPLIEKGYVKMQQILREDEGSPILKNT
jgi:NTE family protein